MDMLEKRSLNRTLSVAPMLDWTDRHCRYFHRLLAPSALLYTEMVTTGAIIHGDADRYLAYTPEEHPVALQLGGSEPTDLAERGASSAAGRPCQHIDYPVVSVLVENHYP